MSHTREPLVIELGAMLKELSVDGPVEFWQETARQMLMTMWPSLVTAVVSDLCATITDQNLLIAANDAAASGHPEASAAVIAMSTTQEDPND